MDALKALHGVDFDWVRHIDSVWTDSPYDVSELHDDLRREILGEMDRIAVRRDAVSPLGWVVVGGAGTGKTHLLGSVRKELAARNFGFILVDMTDVHNFWETILLGFLSSLHKSYSDGAPQYGTLLENLVAPTNLTQDPRAFVGELGSLSPGKLPERTNQILGALRRVDAHRVVENQDIIRALVLLNSDDFAAGAVGYSWLQGLGLEDRDREFFRFRIDQERPITIVRALSWAMSLGGPVLVALDQLDAIVTQHHLASGGIRSDEHSQEQMVSRAIIEGIGGGLSALWEVSRRTLVVVSCLETTWQNLISTVSKTYPDRYVSPKRLNPVSKASTAERLVRLRLEEAYREKGFAPPYPTWPFKREAFQEAEGLFPREILKLCDRHRQAFFKQSRVWEVSSLKDVTEVNGDGKSNAEMQRLDYLFNDLRQKADPADMLHEDNEDNLGGLLLAACICLIKEIEIPGDVDTAVDEETGGSTKSYKSLHARLRLIYRAENDREEHFCMRVLQRTHATSYQARLKAAVTASGIDTRLTFRNLVVIRTSEVPSGAKTQKITKQFLDAGGTFLSPAAEDLRTVSAVVKMQELNEPLFPQWLKSRKPMARSKLVEALAKPLHDPNSGKVTQPSEQETCEEHKHEHGGSNREAERLESRTLPLGFRLVGDRETDPVSIPVQVMTQHTIILAGSGSGKTVLVRRLVEEAALLGIPSIVVDCANDLARLGDRRPEIPEQWKEGEQLKAAQYHEKTDVVVWTPGKMLGNPLTLNPIPDLASLAGNPEDLDELEAAISMTRGALEEVAAPGNSVTSKNKQGVLSAALRYFAERGYAGLDEFIELLADLPSEAGAGIRDASRLGGQMADSLRARKETDVLFRLTGSELDPGVLFGSDAPGGKTRISVINFIGLPTLDSQQQFLNRLAMTLFTWIKKNPAPVRGLLVIDEAKDFVPSGKSTACKASLLRLTAQARKYGLGLILATQAPKDIDHTIVGNCSTHFYGKASSPAAIDVGREQLKMRGGSGDDIPRLPIGQFYGYCAEHFPKPLRIAVPLCLSYHPKNPLTDGEVLDRAIRTKHRRG